VIEQERIAAGAATSHALETLSDQPIYGVIVARPDFGHHAIPGRQWGQCAAVAAQNGARNDNQ
jgi:hypothetical protein